MRLVLWSVAVAVAACSNGAGDGARDGARTDSAARTEGAPAPDPRFAPDTQLVRDSLGNELLIVSKRTAGLLPREVHPRAGAGDPDDPGAWRVVAAEDARVQMESARPPWYVIDVRDSRAWVTRGRISGAALVPLEDLEANVEDLHVRTDQVVLLYGDDERRALAAARILASHGFPHLRVLQGGLDAWSRAGLPVEGR